MSIFHFVDFNQPRFAVAANNRHGGGPNDFRPDQPAQRPFHFARKLYETGVVFLIVSISSRIVERLAFDGTDENRAVAKSSFSVLLRFPVESDSLAENVVGFHELFRGGDRFLAFD